MSLKFNKKNNLKFIIFLAIFIIASLVFCIYLHSNNFLAEEINYSSKKFEINDFFASSKDIVDKAFNDPKINYIPDGEGDKYETNLEDINSSDDVVKQKAKKAMISFFGINYESAFDENGLPKPSSNLEVKVRIKTGKNKIEKEIDLKDWLEYGNENFAYKVLKESFYLGKHKFYFIVTPKNGAKINDDTKPIEIEAKYNYKLAFEKAFNIYYQGKQIWYNENKNKWEYKVLFSNIIPEKTNVISTYYTGEKIKIGFIYSKEYLIRLNELDESISDSDYYKKIGYDEEKQAFLGNIEKEYPLSNLLGGLDEKPIDFGKDSNIRNLGEYDFTSYSPIRNRIENVKDWECGGLKLIVEKQPILCMFSSFTKQKDFIDLAKEFADTPMEMSEIDQKLEDKGIAENKRTSAYEEKDGEKLLPSYKDLLSDKFNYYKYMLRLEKTKDGKFTSNMKVPTEHIIALLKETESEPDDIRPGKIYTSFENNYLKVYGLNSKEFNVKIKAETKEDYDTKDNSNSFKNAIDYKKVINATQYIFNVYTENSNIALVNENMEYLEGQYTDGSQNYDGSTPPDGVKKFGDTWKLNFAKTNKTEGTNFKIIYTILKAKLPKIDFPRLNTNSPFYYTGSEIELKPYIHGENQNIKYSLKYKKILNGKTLNISTNSLIDAGEYEIELTILDENYDEYKQIVKFENNKVKIMPIDYQAMVDVTLSTLIVNGKPTPTTTVNITLPYDLSIADSKTKFSIDGGEFTSDPKKLLNLPTGKHTITLYSESSNFTSNNKITKEITVPDKREIPMLGQIIGGIIPSVASFDVMILFLLTVVLAIVSVIMILVAIPRMIKSKKNVDKPYKERKNKKYDSYYKETIDKKILKKQEKLKTKNLKKIEKQKNK